MRHRPGLIVATTLVIVAALIHFFGWWETLAILLIKFALGVKVGGAKTLAHAVVQAGGKKALAAATAGMLAKRHLIDLFSKFFSRHSLSRWRDNLLHVLKLKYDELRRSPPAKRLKAFGTTLLSVPVIYFLWTKVVSAAVQKILYAMVLPLFSFLWNLLLTGMNILGFVLQVLMLNVFLEALAHSRFGRRLLTLIDRILYLFTAMIGLIDKALSLIGIHPRRWLIRHSIRFNHWLGRIIDRGLPFPGKLANRRDRYINGVESIYLTRARYAESRRKRPVPLRKKIRTLYERKVLKQRSWREKRLQRSRARRQRHARTAAAKRQHSLRRDLRRFTLYPHPLDTIPNRLQSKNVPKKR